MHLSKLCPGFRQSAQPAAEIINETEEKVPEPATASTSAEPGPLGKSDAPAKHQQSAEELKPSSDSDVSSEELKPASDQKAAEPVAASESTPGPAGTTTPGTDATEDGRMPPPAGEVRPGEALPNQL